MKKNKIAILFLLALTVLIGCNKDKELEPRQPKVTDEELMTSSNSAAISWMVDFPGVIHTGVEIGLAEDLADFRSIEAFKNQANQNAVYSVGIDSLVPMTKYYYRQVVWNSYKRFEFDVKEFTTKAGLPIVETFEVGDITPTSAKGSGKVVSDSGAEIIECGICWATATHPTIQADHIVAEDSHDVFVLEMTDLLPGIRYYVRAYAKNSVGFVYGNEVEFTTLQLDNYTVSVSANPTNGGTATGGGSFQQGQSCTVRATANTGYTFVNWTENGNQVSANSNYTFTVNGNRTLVANFTAGSYIISATVDPENSGTITGAGGYEYGQSCTLKATANTGYTFEKWTENGTQVSTNATYTFTVSGNRSLVAHFKVNSYTITVSANPAAGGVATGGGTFEYGQSCTLLATANSGYNFSNWTEGGNVVSSNSSYTFTVTGNRTLKANFTQQAPQNYTISVSANPSDGGTVSGAGIYQHGQSCTVIAEANRSSSFYVDFEDGQIPIGWTLIDSDGDGNNWMLASTAMSTGYGHNASVDMILSKSYDNNTGALYPDNYFVSPQVTLGAGSVFRFFACGQDASFAREHFGVAVSSDGTNFTMIQEWTMTAKGGKAVRDGRDQGTWRQYTVDLSAYAGQQCYIAIRHFNCSDQDSLDVDDVELTGSNGFSFLNWTENGNVVSTNASYTFTVNSNRNLVANFTQQTQQSYHINVSANPSSGGSVSGGGTYQQGQACTLHAAANNGYTFVNWTENGTQVSANANYTFMVNSNRYIVANFAHNGGGGNAPTGAINGKFTINANGDQVYFSQGNLQYQASTNTWRFATNQYDYIGEANSNISQTYSGWIDLFGWGTSGYNHGAVCYQPWSTSQLSRDYYAYGQNTYSLYDQTGQADWGYNAISNGGNTTNTWRTLTGGTNGEWKYIFNWRVTMSGIRYAKAMVNGVKGVVLLPDDWSESYYSLNSTNTSDANFSTNVITAQQWSLLEQHGAVFMPAAGRRYGTSVDRVGSYGYYWSSSDYSSDEVYIMFFLIGYLVPVDYSSRSYGFSVRLVQDYNR